MLREGRNDAMADRGQWPTPTAKTALRPSPIHCLFPAPCPQRILSICCGPFCIRIAFCKTQHALPPFDRFVADRRRRKRANSRISWVGRQAEGGAAMTFADGIGNLSSRKKSQLTCSMSSALPNLLRVVLDANTHSSCANILITLFLRVTLQRGRAVRRHERGRNGRDKFSKMNH